MLISYKKVVNEHGFCLYFEWSKQGNPCKFWSSKINKTGDIVKVFIKFPPTYDSVKRESILIYLQRLVNI